MDISAFYGITTTTLVVMASTTVAIFQVFSTAFTAKVNRCKEELSNLVNSDGDLDYDFGPLKHSAQEFGLLKIYDDCYNLIEDIDEQLIGEIVALFLVLSIAAVSMGCILFTGAIGGALNDSLDSLVDIEIKIKTILQINLAALVIYMFALFSFSFRFWKRRKTLIIFKSKVNELKEMLNKIDQFKKKIANLDSE